MLSAKGRIYSFGSLTLIGFVASLVGVATQSPEAAATAGVVTATATQTGIISFLQNKGSDLFLEICKGLGSIGLEMGADDARQVLIKVAERLNTSDSNRNHEIAKAIRQAILSVIENEKTEISDWDDKKSIEKILKTTEDTWAWVELLEQDNLITIEEEKILLFFAVKAEDIAKIESPVKKSEWKLILLEIARQNNCSLTQVSLDQISRSLYEKFPQSLREVFAQDFANEGVAYGKLLLALVGDINASQAEISDEIIDVSQKQDKYQLENREWFRTLYEEIKKSSVSPVLPKYISADGFPAPKTYFTGRKDVLKNIKDELERSKRATLHGISGLGKTSVLLEVAKLAENDYKHIIFLRATKDNALNSFARTAEKLDESAKNLEKDTEKAARFKTWLEENDGWLLLIDNVDVPGEVLPLLPTNLRGDILASGNPSEIMVLGNEVEIKPMTFESGELLLYRRARTLANYKDDDIKARLENELPTEQTVIKNLVKEFDGLPLALNLAGAYIHKFNKKFAEYEALYEKSAHQLLAKQDINDQYQNDSVAKAFSLAFETIAKPENGSSETRQIAETAVLFLKTASFLNPQAIPLEVLNLVISDRYESSEQLDQDELFRDEVYAKIAQFDLLEKYFANDTVNIHRLVQLVVNNKIEIEEKFQICEQILKILAYAMPQFNFINKEICERYVNHIESVLRHVDKLNLVNRNSFLLYNRIAHFQWLSGNYKKAEYFYHKNWKISEDFFGKEHSATASAIGELANVYESLGRYDEAIEKNQVSLRIFEKIIGKTHPVYITRLHNLANVYSSQSRYYEAIEIFEEVLELNGKVIGKWHSDYAANLSSLSVAYQAIGRYDVAIEKIIEALMIDEKTIGKEHPTYAIHINNLANIYIAQGKYAEALPLLGYVLKIDKKMLGESHPDYAVHLNTIANIYISLNKYDQAIEKLKEALIIEENTIGKNHPNYALSLNNLAEVYRLQNKYDEAIKLLKQVLHIFEKTIGKNHSNFATALSNLAFAYKSQSNYDEAIIKFEEYLQVAVNTSEYKSPTFVINLNHLASLYLLQKNYEKAIEKTGEILLILMKTIGKEHPDYAINLSNLGMTKASQGKYSEAILILEEAVQILVNSLGENDPITKEIKENLEYCRNLARRE